MTTSEERSPLKDMPLRLPGQGLQEKRQEMREACAKAGLAPFDEA